MTAGAAFSVQQGRWNGSSSGTMINMTLALTRMKNAHYPIRSGRLRRITGLVQAEKYH